MSIKIDNSKEGAMHSWHWHNPGAKLYDAICLDSAALHEAYLEVGDIHNTEEKKTPFTKSGCKYPHHSLNKDGILVVNIDGLRAAYQRAKQMGIFKGAVKEHLVRHYKELDLYDNSEMKSDETITENFQFIESVLGIDESSYVTESADSSSIEELEDWIDDVSNNGFNDDCFEESSKETTECWVLTQGDPLIYEKFFIKSDDGVDNCCLKVHGYEHTMRGRSSMITLKYDGEWKVLCRPNGGGDYGVPGGGWNKDEAPKDAAIRELQEEALRNVRNVKRMGTLIEYDNTNVAKWVKDHVPEKDWWYGYYSAIFVGIDNGEFTGHVDKQDRESGFKWIPVKEVTDKFPKEYVQAINDYIYKMFDVNMIHKPDDLIPWLDHISYDSSIKEWKLKSPEETWDLKSGNCHDQSLFEFDILKKISITCGQLFFIEVNKGESVGGNTHTLTWYKENDKYFWMEHAWEDQKGIHGPYASFNLLRKDVYDRWKHDNDLNSGKFSTILFSEINKYKIGMTLGEYVEAWDFTDSTYEEAMEWIDMGNHGIKVFTEAGEEPSEIELGDEEIPSDEPIEETSTEEPKQPEKPLSFPKQTDAQESDKNGVRRKKLYIAFIEWAKKYNNKNTFGSIFDKDIFHNVYPFIPHEMRYFYRLANPIMCVLAGDLTFFQVSELKNVNKDNKKMNELLIFAATPNDLRIFNNKDKKIYRGIEENNDIVLQDTLGETFDLYLQEMIKAGDILNSSINEEENEL